MPIDKLATQPNCSFCGLGGNAVEEMIKGPNDLHICSDCIDLCAELIAISKQKKQSRCHQGESRGSEVTDIPNFLKKVPRPAGSENKK